MSENKKTKYNTKILERELDINRVIYVPGMMPTNSNHQNSNTNIESNLIQSKSTYENKTDIKLDIDNKNKEKDYRNFTLNSQNKRESLNNDYIPSGYKGNGRGFGDLSVDLKLRYGHNSRKEQKTARNKDLHDYKFNHVYENYNDINNIVLPFPCNGIDTRNLDKFKKN